MILTQNSNFMSISENLIFEIKKNIFKLKAVQVSWL